MLVLQINDLDTEDSKKDTLVDVVFKKALKEFRLNIFNSYSTVLAVSNHQLPLNCYICFCSVRSYFCHV